MLYSSLNQMEPMIPKGVNAFSEYHAVWSEEKRNELSEKLENRRERITQGRRGFWRFSDEEPNAEEINGNIADRLDLTPEQETEMLPLTEKLLIEREEIQQVRLSIFDEVIVQLNNESAETTPSRIEFAFGLGRHPSTNPFSRRNHCFGSCNSHRGTAG